MKNTDPAVFFEQIEGYVPLSEEAKREWEGLLKPRSYSRGMEFLRVGQVPRRVAFVVKGLFSQSYITDSGDTVIKYFFPEGRIAGSVPAILMKCASNYAIVALEDTDVLEYDYQAFRELVGKHRDIAAFYIRYLEQHWVIEKEPYEISLRHDDAKTRYEAFLKEYPALVKRLKKHHIAAYLGITPTQLSRIFFANK